MFPINVENIEVGTQEEEVLSPLKLGWRSFLRDKMGILGGIMVIALLFFTIFGHFVSPYDPLRMDSTVSFRPPSSTHWMGTDRFGRDQTSRIIVGTKVSMTVSLGSIGLAVIFGTIIGLIAGYYGGLLDSVVMRLVDVVFAFPTLLLALAMVAALGPNMMNLLIVIGVIYSVRFARIVRGSTLSVKEKEFIEGIKSVGASDFIIMLRFILPNILSPIIVQATFALAHAIMIEASLSFIGLGTQPPQPSWGAMLNEARPFMQMFPWLAIFPGLAIIFAVLGFNFLGDGLRDALDPRLSQR